MSRYKELFVISAGTVFATVGFCSEKMHLFLALDLTETEQRLEPEERIELVHLTIDEVRARLKAHQFNDAKTVVVLHALLQHLAS